MASSSLKSSAVKGAIWTFIDKFSRQIIQFIIGIILARLLSPEDYGVIGMIGIFIAIAHTFTESGLGSALIQKKDCSDADYSTIFFFNLTIALLFYAIIFVSAPVIAHFYRLPILKGITRIVALQIIITGLTTVQVTRLTKELRFKEQSIISIVSMLVSGAAGLVMAFYGWGVWSLVFQTLIAQIVTSVCIWYLSKWKPKLVFSKNSFKQLWKFGSKILGSSLINTIYGNIYTMIIGKAFSPSQVGFYNRGNQYAFLPVQTIQDMAISVNYPVLAKMQDDNQQLLRAYKKLMSVPLYILYPLLTGLAVIAPYLIPLMIGEKWSPCVPILQILCLGYMFSPLTHLNLNLLYVKGRTDLVLKLELIKKPIAFAILFVSIPFGLIWMIVGKAAYEFVAFSFNCYYTGKILGYGELKQLKVLMPIFISCAIMAGVVYFAMFPFSTHLAKVCAGVVTGVTSYIICSVVSKNECFFALKEIVVSLFTKE